MRKIEAIIRRSKLEEVVEALTKMGIDGMTIAEVKGYGKQVGIPEVYRGTETLVKLLSRYKIEIIVSKEKSDDIIKLIIAKAHTGEIGDGRIYVYPIDKAFSIRKQQEITDLV